MKIIILIVFSLVAFEIRAQENHKTFYFHNNQIAINLNSNFKEAPHFVGLYNIETKINIVIETENGSYESAKSKILQNSKIILDQKSENKSRLLVRKLPIDSYLNKYILILKKNNYFKIIQIEDTSGEINESNKDIINISNSIFLN